MCGDLLPQETPQVGLLFTNRIDPGFLSCLLRDLGRFIYAIFLEVLMLPLNASFTLRLVAVAVPLFPDFPTLEFYEVIDKNGSVLGLALYERFENGDE